MTENTGIRSLGQNRDVESASLTVGYLAPVKLRIDGGKEEERHAVMIYNNSSNILYVGGCNVSTGDGLPVASEEYLELDLGKGDAWGIANTGMSNDIRILEV